MGFCSVVAEIVLQKIEEQALATYKQTIRLWLRYVDNTFTTAVHWTRSTISRAPSIEREHTVYQGDLGKVTVTRDTDRLRTTIYGKLTHAHRLLTLMQTKLTFLFAVLRKYFMISMIRSNFYNKIKTLIPSITLLPINVVISEVINSSNYFINIQFIKYISA